jgi:hypothetical protein
MEEEEEEERSLEGSTKHKNSCSEFIRHRPNNPSMPILMHSTGI